VVNAEAAQKQRQQNAHHFIATHYLILLVKDRLRVGIRLAAHGRFSLLSSLDTQPATAMFPDSQM
jgi:hypothetical protein